MTVFGAFLVALGAVSVVAWLWLVAARGRFWRADQMLAGGAQAPAHWPEIAAVVPARNEADVIGRAIESLATQDYPGAFSIVVVDDGSDDGTGAAARAASSDVDVIDGQPLAAGWAGKMWAVHQGVSHAEANIPDAAFVWLTDADIAHDPTELRRLVAMAEADRLDLVSLMVKLHCRTSWERLLIPAFVFFFQKLYPFPWINDPARRTAGAAGGSMLVRRSALARIGGIAAIRSALIDDCALARAIKTGGPIWLGLTRETQSLRAYDGLAGIWSMVARTAFDQLGYSWAALAGTVIGMLVLYVAPPALALAGLLGGSEWIAGVGAAGWALMTMAYVPTVRLYGLGIAAALTLPAAAVLYTAMTIDSARRHAQGRGGAWKARTYAMDRES